MNEAAVRQLWDRICRKILGGEHPPIVVSNLEMADCFDRTFERFKSVLRYPTSRKTFFDTYSQSLKNTGINLGMNLEEFSEKYGLGAKLNAADEVKVKALKLQGWTEENSASPCPPVNPDPNKEYKKFPSTGEPAVCLSKNKFSRRYPQEFSADNPFWCINNYKYYTETAGLRKSILSSTECERVYDETIRKSFIICYHTGGGVKLYGLGSDEVLKKGVWECFGDAGYVIKWFKKGSETQFDGTMTVFDVDKPDKAETN